MKNTTETFGFLSKKHVRNCILILTSLLLTFSMLLPVHGQEKSPVPGKLYDVGIDLFYKEKYEEALRTFTNLIHTFPASNLVSYSHHMIGQCYLKMGRYEEALQQFEFYRKTYPEGDRLKTSEQGIQVAKEKLKELALAASSGKRARRRICAQIFYLDGKTLDLAEKRIKALKEAGVDTLILRVFHNKGDRAYQFAAPRHEECVYFKTDYAPMVDDILGKVADIAHRNGLEIFAWMTTRYANYGLESQPALRCKRYNFETHKLELARGFNLFHPEVLQRLEGLFRDLGSYPIDGILFQDDLVLKHNEDFSTEANKAFFKEFGYSPHPDKFYINPCKSPSGKYYVKAYSDRFWSWANWKNRWLMDVAKRLMEAARRSNPQLKFGINLYYETVVNDSNSAAWFSQTLREAMERDFDYYAIMAYHRQTMNELNLEAKKAMDLMAEVAQKAATSIGDPSRVMIKVQVLDWKSYQILPTKEVETLLDGILRQGEFSLAFVPYVEQFPFSQLKGKWTRP